MGLPTRRRSLIYSAKVGPAKVHVGAGFFTDGTLREIWIDTYTEGSPVRALYHTIAQLVSLGLRAGVNPQTIARVLESSELPAAMVEEQDESLSSEPTNGIPGFVARILRQPAEPR
jgi:ribonucleoside-diphosphate reductase alpha chain